MAEISQKIISCPKGHYYDANRYQSCPICSSGKFSSTVDPSAGGIQAASYGANGNGGSGGFSHTVPPDGGQGEGSGWNGGNFNQTLPPDNDPVEKMSKTEFVDPSTPTGHPSPVTGWLVAVDGPVRGTDYRIHTGYNHIGRKRGDIVIHGDNTISAEQDANVTYVYQTRRFYIAHELGKNVLLVNDVPVVGGSVELKPYDVITIGSSKLMFVPFCGEHFSWDYEGQGNG